LVGGGLNDYPCGGDLVMADYLNLPVVRDALHVKKSDFFSVDNAEGDFDYVPSERDLTGFYKEVNGRLRILIYNGGMLPLNVAADDCVNLFCSASLLIDETSLFSRC
jgi:hypothetical protein